MKVQGLWVEGLRVWGSELKGLGLGFGFLWAGIR